MSTTHNAGLLNSQNTNMFENIQRGTYLVGDTYHYFRSKWELKYACYLEWLKQRHEIQDWKYEPRTFEFPIKHGTTRYMPDFRIDLLDGTCEWHEVKGFLTPKGNTQIKRFKKYYPKEKHIIITREWFNSVRHQEKLWLPK